MPYDENSFLQGIAVGRSMKGVTVIGGKREESPTVYSRVISPSVNVLALEAVTENSDAGSVGVFSAFFAPTGNNIPKSETVPGTLTISGISASAVVTIDT